MSEVGRVRIEVGFEGGQVIGGFVDAAHADQLERALHEDGPRVIVLDTEDVATYFPGTCHGTLDTSNARIFGSGIVSGSAALVDSQPGKDRLHWVEPRALSSPRGGYHPG